jgi:hypothetical protein
MALPWLRILDAVIGVTDLARSRKIRSMAAENDAQQPPTDVAARGLGGMEARLAGVMVAALKEVFERDSRRLDLEREQIETERRRAERALQLELMRQAAEREIGRLRLLAGVDMVAWLSSLIFAVRVAGASTAARVMLGVGWVLLLAAIAASFSGQSAVARAVEAERPVSSALGAVALWLTVAGLALVAFAALV